MKPSTDIKRICARCGAFTYCCILRESHVDKYGANVEKAEAVCPACAEGEEC